MQPCEATNIHRNSPTSTCDTAIRAQQQCCLTFWSWVCFGSSAPCSREWSSIGLCRHSRRSRQSNLQSKGGQGGHIREITLKFTLNNFTFFFYFYFLWMFFTYIWWTDCNIHCWLRAMSKISSAAANSLGRTRLDSGTACCRWWMLDSLHRRPPLVWLLE